MGIASERENAAKARRRKSRVCKCCGKRMPPYDLWVCEDCRLAGRAAELGEIGRIQVKELMEVASARQGLMNPLEGFTVDEIQALSWEFRKEGYGSYGKLRGYVDATGRLPERGKM